MLTLQHLYSLIDSNQIYTQAMKQTISQFGSKIIIFMLRILSHAPEDVRNSYKGIQHLIVSSSSKCPPDTFTYVIVSSRLFHISITIKYCNGGGTLQHRTLLCLTLTLYQDTISQHRTLFHIAISIKYCPLEHFNIGHYYVLQVLAINSSTDSSQIYI